MQSIGIDVGSTYTKYCVMADDGAVRFFIERTPVRQRDYFKKTLARFAIEYPNYKIISCGYGKHNIEAVKKISELTALAIGLNHQLPGCSVALDIGGQDTKLIRQYGGEIKEFFVNDKCAAGSGLFLTNVLNILDVRFEEINLACAVDVSDIKLSSVCAVFAQSEIVELLANDIAPQKIIIAVIRQILIQASSLLNKCEHIGEVVLSGGLTKIKGINEFATNILDERIIIPNNPQHLSAIGCAVIGR